MKKLAEQPKGSPEEIQHLFLWRKNQKFHRFKRGEIPQTPYALAVWDFWIGTDSEEVFPPDEWYQLIKGKPSHKQSKKSKRIQREIYHRLKFLIETERAFGQQRKARQAAWEVARFFCCNNHPVKARKNLPAGYYCEAGIALISGCSRVPQRTVKRKIAKFIQHGFIQRKARGRPLDDAGNPYSYYARSYWRVATTLQEWQQFHKEALQKGP